MSELLHRIIATDVTLFRSVLIIFCGMILVVFGMGFESLLGSAAAGLGGLLLGFAVMKINFNR